ncbi:MAG: hypothetical protein FWB84_07620 [Candidatus Bathyarchaeota archaeon]|uniref:hypothetical protein n=1 Tax=Candidatus Bathycorpusculum sp. TaxID=2994959 RepID=UPI0028304104|nr:hypothetical protein [Candidatus Termiticorpusculum sp.]MCL2256653.1 hypothetical protein [Candidatus Termiticorpusculum sp.]MCL2292808.1 hypothetical protein [Candidatus Termiticorpusculum sp.]
MEKNIDISICNNELNSNLFSASGNTLTSNNDSKHVILNCEDDAEINVTTVSQQTIFPLSISTAALFVVDADNQPANVANYRAYPCNFAAWPILYEV